jgi:hypothetical protein
MLDYRNILFVAIFGIASGSVLADTRPDSPPARTLEEMKRVVKLGHHVRCSMSQRVELETSDGLTSPDSERKSKIIFKNLEAVASSDSDFATYNLSWGKDKDNFKFHFYMNSQVGEIRISDKKNGISATSNLDLSDFGKQEVYIGKTRLIRSEAAMVTSPIAPGNQVPGVRTTSLIASCQFLEDYVP